MAHAQHIGRQLQQAARPGPIGQLVRNGVAFAKARQLLEHRRIGGKANIWPRGILGEINRPRNAIRIGDRHREHIKHPVRA